MFESYFAKFLAGICQVCVVYTVNSMLLQEDLPCVFDRRLALRQFRADDAKLLLHHLFNKGLA